MDGNEKRLIIGECCLRHDAGADPVPIAQSLTAIYGVRILCVGVPGINGLLSPVDVAELVVSLGVL